MRAIGFGLFAACVLIALPSHAAERNDMSEDAPANAEEAATMHMQAVGDRWPDRWQGRQHYLFDKDDPPETTGSSRAAEPQACATEPVRVRRADGSTEVKRINRCR